jgi:hypothetical protein
VICSMSSCDGGGIGWVSWGTTTAAPNVVWGTRCGGADCDPASSSLGVTGTIDGDGVVWGTSDGDGVVWGTSGADGDGVVWGTSCLDPSCQSVIWGQQ